MPKIVEWDDFYSVVEKNDCFLVVYADTDVMATCLSQVHAEVIVDALNANAFDEAVQAQFFAGSTK
jgi:hypothetical protein